MRQGFPVFLALALASCAPYQPPPGRTPPPNAALPAGAPAQVANTSIGPVLADARGMTLYTFTKDPPSQSACNGSCAAEWPPLIASPTAVPAGAWSIIVRADGSRQWAYRGKALYTYVKDHPGATDCDGAGGEWYAARP
jgi:predicted lipoprotein with Yx(FWY)xxD motif